MADDLHPTGEEHREANRLGFRVFRVFSGLNRRFQDDPCGYGTILNR